MKISKYLLAFVMAWGIASNAYAQTYNGHEAVDLGVSVKWATMNMGAEAVGQIGTRYSWGMSTPYDNPNYSWDAYPYTKPFIEGSEYWERLLFIGRDIKGTEYDTVHTIWGSHWRMPTIEEYWEMYDQCTWTWEDIDGTHCRVGTAPNGNRICLPICGEKKGTADDYITYDRFGLYWTSIVKDQNAYTFSFRYGGTPEMWFEIREVARISGLPIRAVYDERPQPSTTEGVRVYENDGTVTDIPASDFDRITPFHPKNDYDAVDLGVSVKWATCNLGATSPEEHGDYYAWGETQTKDQFSTGNYAFGIPPSKYNQTDGLTTLEREDDAACASWGGNWRMPTRSEEEELYEHCTWTWITQNGVDGFRVTGKNGNSIFLPTTGLYDSDSQTEIKRKDTGGWYWTATTNGERYACGICFPSPNDLYTNVPNHEREDGHTIRPVLDEKYAAKGITVYRKNGTEFSVPQERLVSVATYLPEKQDLVEAVDLGLSVKWASCNLGASAPEEAGLYFQWGRAAAIDLNEELPDYPSAEIVADLGLDIAATEYDPARERWGNSWRMPSKAEYQELFDNCECEIISGHPGSVGVPTNLSYVKFTASNGNSIILPYTYYLYGIGVGMRFDFNYWTSTFDTYVRTFQVNTSYKSAAYCISIKLVNGNSSPSKTFIRDLKKYGYPVRAVCP